MAAPARAGPRPGCCRPGGAGRARPVPAPPGAAPSQSSAAARRARGHELDRLGRSAGSARRPGWTVTWPTPTTTGVRGSRAMVRRSVPGAGSSPRGPGAPGPSVDSTHHARRRRFGSRRVRPQGDPEGRAGRAGSRRHRPGHRRRRGPRWTTPTSAPPSAGPWSRARPTSASAPAAPGIGISMAANKIAGRPRRRGARRHHRHPGPPAQPRQRPLPRGSGPPGPPWPSTRCAPSSTRPRSPAATTSAGSPSWPRSTASSTDEQLESRRHVPEGTP